MTRFAASLYLLMVSTSAIAQTPQQTPSAPAIAARPPSVPEFAVKEPKTPWHHHPVIPSALGLLGTVLTATIAFKAFKGTLAFNRQKHREDTENALQKHAADAESNRAKNRADRDLAIRKDIYFSIHAVATEAIFNIITILNRHVSLEETHATMRRLAIEITKYQAVAGKEAMDAAFTLQEIISDAFGELIPSRLHIEKMAESRDNIQARLGELMAQSEAASGEERKEERRKANADLTHVQGVLDKQEEAIRRAIVVHYEAMRGWMQMIQQPQINFIMIARRELGLALDEQWFQQRRDAMLRRALDRLEKTGFN